MIYIYIYRGTITKKCSQRLKESRKMKFTRLYTNILSICNVEKFGKAILFIGQIIERHLESTVFPLISLQHLSTEDIEENRGLRKSRRTISPFFLERTKVGVLTRIPRGAAIYIHLFPEREGAFPSRNRVIAPTYRNTWADT